MSARRSGRGGLRYQRCCNHSSRDCKSSAGRPWPIGIIGVGKKPNASSFMLIESSTVGMHDHIGNRSRAREDVVAHDPGHSQHRLYVNNYTTQMDVGMGAFMKYLREGLMERDTGRQGDKQTGRQADRQTDTQATSRQTHRQTGTQAHRQTGTQAHRQTGRQTQRQTGRQAHRHTGRQAHRQTGSQTDRQMTLTHMLKKWVRVLRSITSLIFAFRDFGIWGYFFIAKIPCSRR